MRTLGKAALVVAALAGEQAHAAGRPLSINDLVTQSAVIVNGEVSNIKYIPITKTGADGHKRTSQMISEITVAGNVLKGPTSSTAISFQQLGGYDASEDMTYEISELPTFNKGEHVIVFLRPGYQEGARTLTPIVGWEAGKFSVTPGPDGQDIVANSLGLTRPQPNSGSQNASVTLLGDFLSQLDLALRATQTDTLDITGPKVSAPILGSPAVKSPFYEKE